MTLELKPEGATGETLGHEPQAPTPKGGNGAVQQETAGPNAPGGSVEPLTGPSDLEKDVRHAVNAVVNDTIRKAIEDIETSTRMSVTAITGIGMVEHIQRKAVDNIKATLEDFKKAALEDFRTKTREITLSVNTPPDKAKHEVPFWQTFWFGVPFSSVVVTVLFYSFLSLIDRLSDIAEIHLPWVDLKGSGVSFGVGTGGLIIILVVMSLMAWRLRRK